MENLNALIKKLDHSPEAGVANKEVRAQLEVYIRELIDQDFSKLVDLLYRVDIPEKKLKALLALEENSDTAALITDLIIERQLQKRALKQQHPPATDIPEEERW